MGPTRLMARSRGIAEALFADGDHVDRARIDWLVHDLDDFLRSAGARPRLVFALCVTVLSLFAPLLIGRLSSLESLTVAERTGALNRAERGLLGPAALAAKAILCLLWFEHPDADRQERGQ